MSKARGLRQPQGTDYEILVTPEMIEEVARDIREISPVPLTWHEAWIAAIKYLKSP